MKKHRNMMKAAEIEGIEKRVREIAAVAISSHAAERMNQKAVSVKEIENCLKYGFAVEIHNEAEELRAVIRFQYGKPKVAVCLVVGLETGTLVTTWKNAGSDNHKTLNSFAYDKGMPVLAMLARR